jgi:hypothetical protein
LPGGNGVLHVNGTFDGVAYVVTTDNELAVIGHERSPYGQGFDANLTLRRIPRAGNDIIDLSVGTDTELGKGYDTAWVVHADHSVGVYRANSQLVESEYWGGVSQAYVSPNNSGHAISAGGDGVAYYYDVNDGLDIQVSQGVSGPYRKSTPGNLNADVNAAVFLLRWAPSTGSNGNSGGNNGGGSGGIIDTRSHGGKETVQYQ